MAKDSVAEVRTWAKQRGFDVGDRGRLPAEVWQAWEDRASRSASRTPRQRSQPEPSATPRQNQVVEQILRDQADLRAQLEQLQEQHAAVVGRLDQLVAGEKTTKKRFGRGR